MKYDTLLFDYSDQGIYYNECSSSSNSSTEKIKDSFDLCVENNNRKQKCARLEFAKIEESVNVFFLALLITK